MRRYGELLIWCTSILVIFMLLTACVDSQYDLPLVSTATFANIASALASVVTLVIAILLFRRFNGSQSLVDKQTEASMRLVKFISDLHLFTETMDSKTGTTPQSYFAMKVFNFRWCIEKDKILEHKGKKLKQYANYSAMSLLSGITNFANELYLPKEIAATIRSIYPSPHWISEKNTDVPSYYVVLSVRGDYEDQVPVRIGDDTGEYSDLLVKVGDELFDIEHLMKQLEKIYEQTVKWLRDNNGDVYGSLNITPTKVNDYC